MKISRKSLKLIALLISSLLIGTVSATAYVRLQWTATTTVAGNPKVCFVLWTAPTTKLNTFDYSVNIFPSVKTIDENITHGIWNWDSSSHSVSMRIYSISNQTGNIQSVTTYVKTVDGVTTKITVSFTDGESLPKTYQTFTADASTYYLIWVEVTAKSGAGPGMTSTITYDMKVENP